MSLLDAVQRTRTGSPALPAPCVTPYGRHPGWFQGTEVHLMKKSNAMVREDHHRISPTARIAAYFRSFSDIPYAEEVSKVLRGEEAARQHIHHDDLDFVTSYYGP